MTVIDSRRSTGGGFGRLAFRPVWSLLTLVVILSLLGVAVPAPYRYVPLLASLLLLGIPHGALDHLTVPRARGLPVGVRSLVVVGLLYLCLGLAYLAVWFSAPSIALLFFLLLTWYHWGQGDLYPLLALTERTHLRTRTQRALTVVVRGGIPMVVPLLAFPAEYRDVASSVVGLFDPAASLFWLESPLARLVLGVGFALVTVGALAAGRPGRTDPAARASWRLDVRETTLLWVFFLAVPPVVAIGLYFPLWHSLRHLLRVAALDPAGGESTRSRVRSIALDAAPTTAGALVIFGVLALAVPADVGGVESVAAAYLVLLAVLTLPHVVVVTWLDRLQGVWEPR